MAVQQADLRPAPVQEGWLERINQEMLLGGLLILISLGLSLYRPDFLAVQSIESTLLDSSRIVVAVVGMTLVIVSGGIDISIGSMLAMCSVLGGLVAQAGYPAPLAWLVIILSGTFFGFLNGSLVIWGGVPSIITTLGMMTILRGAVVLVSGGSWIQNLPDDFYIGQKDLFGVVPVPVAVAVVVLTIGALWMRYAAVGRYFYAVGANRNAARLTGINVKGIQMLSFVINGTLAGVAALIFATRFGAIQTNAGVGFELQVITAAVIGGVSILGGAGTVLGGALGALLLSVISKGLIFVQVSSYWFLAVQGILILLAVIFDILRKRRIGEM